MQQQEQRKRLRCSAPPQFEPPPPPLPPQKRAAPTVGSLQRELQQERERHRRSLESTEQLRLEVQMLGRLLASAREQIVALGGTALSTEAAALRAGPSAAVSRPAYQCRSDTRTLQRLQGDLVESKGQCKRLIDEVGALQNKLQQVHTSKKELLAVTNEMQEYLVAGNPG